MKKNNLIYLFTLLIVGIFFTSCSDDDDHDDDHNNEITITIEEPLNGETITDCANVHIHIDIEASDENHEVEIILHPEGDINDIILDFDLHDHDQVITFDQVIDLCSYPAGTCFHLEVEACVDHDCEEKSRADLEFCLQ